MRPIKLTLLRTGTPIPMLERRGPASLVTIGNARILVDAGSGVVHPAAGSGSANATTRGGPTGADTTRSRRTLGPIAAFADTAHLVLNHVIGPPDTSSMERDISRNYPGTITVGADLQEFGLGRQ